MKTKTRDDLVKEIINLFTNPLLSHVRNEKYLKQIIDKFLSQQEKRVIEKVLKEAMKIEHSYFCRLSNDSADDVVCDCDVGEFIKKLKE